MAEYVPFHPDNQVLGSAIAATLAALGSEEVSHILKQHNIETLNEGTWYPQQLELDILRTVSQERFYLDLVSIGMKIPEVAKFPPQISEVHQALAMLNTAYNMNVQGANVGEYIYERLDDRKAKITAHNPYPSDFDYGIIYGLVKRFRPADSTRILVKRDDSIPNRKTGGDTCTYTVEW